VGVEGGAVVCVGVVSVLGVCGSEAGGVLAGVRVTCRCGEGCVLGLGFAGTGAASGDGVVWAPGSGLGAVALGSGLGPELASAALGASAQQAAISHEVRACRIEVGGPKVKGGLIASPSK
jgi:hypothetical protein